MRLSLFILLFALSMPAISAQTLDVTLKIDGNSNTVYIPASGAGEIAASGLTGQAYTNPNAFYLATMGPDYLLALVNYAGKPVSLSTRKAANSHYLTVSQGMQGSNVFLAFSRGSQNTIENRLPLIREGSFLEYAVPTFGFGLSRMQTVSIILSYTNIDISGLGMLSSGLHTLSIEKNGTSNGRPVVEIRRG